MQWVYGEYATETDKTWSDAEDCSHYGQLNEHEDAIRRYCKLHFADLKEKQLKDLLDRNTWLDQKRVLLKARALQKALGTSQSDDMNGFDDAIKSACKKHNITLDAKEKKQITDAVSWKKYQQAGGKLTRDDWRRDNVNRLVQAMFATVRRERPGALFGISPFGLGRPDRRPPGISGFSQFHALYADVELWCERGWCDYLAPQLYWALEPRAQAFGALLDEDKMRAQAGLHRTTPFANRQFRELCGKLAAEAARIGADYGYCEINLNVGCPSERVQSGAFGACLMRQPALVAEGVAAMKAELEKIIARGRSTPGEDLKNDVPVQLIKKSPAGKAKAKKK